MQLADLQKSLAARLAGVGSLSGDTPAPEGLAGAAVERARRALVAKRRQAASHLLPRLRAALGPSWAERFSRHAAGYTPCGLLHHVDDAWEMAEAISPGGGPAERRLAAAAHDDLVILRLRYARDRQAGAHRIRERRSPLLALVRTPVRCLVVRMPGAEGRVWSVWI
jgi:hypothetical protein